MRHEMNRIQGKYHNIKSYRISKISLSSHNDKKYVLKDRYNRLPHIHKYNYQTIQNTIENQINRIYVNQHIQ